MKIITIFILLLSVCVYSQNIGINTTGASPLPSAMLDVDATDKGLLVPRVNIVDLSTAAPVTAPVNSLLVYNTNTTTGKGFYFWDGAKWTKLSDANSNPDDDWYKVGTTSAPTSINDDMFTNGKVGIGVSAPSSGLHIKGSDELLGRIIINNQGPLSNASRVDFRSNGLEMGKIRVVTHDDLNSVMQLSTTSNGVSSAKVFITKDGSVGILEATPLGKLHIKHQTSSSGINTYTAHSLAKPSIVFTDNIGGDNSYITGYDAGLLFSDNLLNFVSAVSNGIAPTPVLYLNNGKIGINTFTPTEKLEVQGSIKIVDGTQGIGKVLTSNANGKGSWSKVLLENASSYSETIMSSTVRNSWVNGGVEVTVPSKGKYLIIYSARLFGLSLGTTANVDNWWKTRLYNVTSATTLMTFFGSNPRTNDGATVNGNGDLTASGSRIMDLETGDILRIHYYVTGTGTSTYYMRGNTDGGSSISIVRIGD